MRTCSQNFGQTSHRMLDLSQYAVGSPKDQVRRSSGVCLLVLFVGILAQEGFFLGHVLPWHGVLSFCAVRMGRCSGPGMVPKNCPKTSTTSNAQSNVPENSQTKCDQPLCVFVSCLSYVSCATCFVYDKCMCPEICPKNVTNCGVSLSHVYHTYLNKYHI